jgi:hypothetical protein
MIELKYDSWEKISVNVFEKLNKRIAEAEVVGIENIDLLNKQIAILSVLCDVDEDRIAELTTNEFSILVNKIEFLNTTPKKNIINKLKINGNEYEVFLSVADMTMNQYIDFQTLYKDREKNFKQLLAIFILPKGKKYCEGYDIKDVINDIGDMPISDANNIMFFFAIAFRSLTKTMLTYSTKMMKKLMKKTKNKERVMKIQEIIDKIEEAQNLVKNGGGYTGLI